MSFRKKSFSFLIIIGAFMLVFMSAPKNAETGPIQQRQQQQQLSDEKTPIQVIWAKLSSQTKETLMELFVYTLTANLNGEKVTAEMKKTLEQFFDKLQCADLPALAEFLYCDRANETGKPKKAPECKWIRAGKNNTIPCEEIRTKLLRELVVELKKSFGADKGPFQQRGKQQLSSAEKAEKDRVWESMSFHTKETFIELTLYLYDLCKNGSKISEVENNLRKILDKFQCADVPILVEHLYCDDPREPNPKEAPKCKWFQAEKNRVSCGELQSKFSHDYIDFQKQFLESPECPM